MTPYERTQSPAPTKFRRYHVMNNQENTRNSESQRHDHQKGTTLDKTSLTPNVPQQKIKITKAQREALKLEFRAKRKALGVGWRETRKVLRESRRYVNPEEQSRRRKEEGERYKLRKKLSMEPFSILDFRSREEKIRDVNKVVWKEEEMAIASKRKKRSASDGGQARKRKDSRI